VHVSRLIRVEEKVSACRIADDLRKILAATLQ
jgi:hypothetical protein